MTATQVAIAKAHRAWAKRYAPWLLAAEKRAA